MQTVPTARTKAHIRAALIGSCAILWTAALGQAASAQSLSEADSFRSSLSTGETIDGYISSDPGASKALVLILRGDEGRLVRVAETSELAWGETRTTISSGKTEVELRSWLKFSADKLPGPAQMRVNNEFYRWLEMPSGEVTSAQRKAQTAIAELPEQVQRDLNRVFILCSGAMEDVMLPVGGLLLADVLPSVPQVSVTKTVRLKPEEATKAFPETAAGPEKLEKK